MIVRSAGKQLLRQILAVLLVATPLASGAGSFMTGTEIIVDGGYAAMTI